MLTRLELYKERNCSMSLYWELYYRIGRYLMSTLYNQVWEPVLNRISKKTLVHHFGFLIKKSLENNKYE